MNDDDLIDGYETVRQRCRVCGHRFRVLADEESMHACPHCQWDGHSEVEDEE
jgi:hypothetical protein